ncbi:hypothetical protein ANCDUO_16735 [Ancylostoma duodenale]|uniref:Uncharacterized protein n=1 Tax=Ancylostoma duodenale TaxID=51022 RepID=A0A0C2G7X3_9BILA|nr:hypothetical protein ANCDUO_16735 [Ancylostoma duodenale]
MERTGVVTFFFGNGSSIYDSQAKLIAKLSMSQDCNGPLGLTNGRIRDDQLSASSSFDSDSTGPQHARWEFYGISSHVRQLSIRLRHLKPPYNGKAVQSLHFLAVSTEEDTIRENRSLLL